MRYLIVLVSCVLFSCGADTPKDTRSLMQQILSESSDGVVRDVTLGMNPEEVKLKEELSALTEEQADYLFYEVQHDSLNSFTISYSFENNSLVEIRVDVYTINDSAAKDLCSEIQAYYSSIYNAMPNEMDGLWRWSSVLNNKASIIELKDESIDYNNVGKITLLVYHELEIPA